MDRVFDAGLVPENGRHLQGSGKNTCWHAPTTLLLEACWLQTKFSICGDFSEVTLSEVRENARSRMVG